MLDLFGHSVSQAPTTSNWALLAKQEVRSGACDKCTMSEWQRHWAIWWPLCILHTFVPVPSSQSRTQAKLWGHIFLAVHTEPCSQSAWLYEINAWKAYAGSDDLDKQLDAAICIVTDHHLMYYDNEIHGAGRRSKGSAAVGSNIYPNFTRRNSRWYIVTQCLSWPWCRWGNACDLDVRQVAEDSCRQKKKSKRTNNKE